MSKLFEIAPLSLKFCSPLDLKNTGWFLCLKQWRELRFGDVKRHWQTATRFIEQKFEQTICSKELPALSEAQNTIALLGKACASLADRFSNICLRWHSNNRIVKPPVCKKIMI